jgi:hypothetical protein
MSTESRAKKIAPKGAIKSYQSLLLHILRRNLSVLPATFQYPIDTFDYYKGVSVTTFI